MQIEDADRKRIVQAIRAYIARERISREEFAKRTKLGKSTVDKLVVGMFSEKTILQIESLLKIKLAGPATAGETALPNFGGYSRADTDKYVGEYVFVRPSFHEADTIQAFHMSIVWDRETGGLVVREAPGEKKVPPQFGVVYIPRASRHIFILSNDEGSLNKVILTQLDMYGRMKGIMLTMGRAFANIYMPMAMPVILNKYDAVAGDRVGRFTSGSRMYQEYSEDLMAVEQGQYARWISVART